MSIADRARFAGSFFSSFMTAQFFVVFCITPLYTASAIAEQKERRTLDFLLVTHLTDREIILGMLGARLAKLLLLLLTGLPVLSLLEFLGGVDPVQVIVGFVATCVLIVTVGSVSILASVHAKSALGAVVVSYLVALFVVGCSFPWFSFAAVTAALDKSRSAGLAPPSTLGAIVALIMFILVYGMVALICCRIAIAQLRRVAMAQAGGGDDNRVRRPPSPLVETEEMGGGWGPYPATRDPETGLSGRAGPAPRSHKTRPRVGADALFWKEKYAESTFGLAALNQPHRAATLAIAGLFYIMLACLNAPQSQGGDGAGEYMQRCVLQTEILVSFVLLAIVALSASRRVSREREWRTLDHLLMLPVGIDEILFAKWRGSILSVSHLWSILVPIWVIGFFMGGLSLFALPLLAAAIIVYAGFVAALGLWLSTISGSTFRASLFTLLAVLIFLAAPGAHTTTGSLTVNLTARHPLWMWQSLLLGYGLSPAATFWALTFREADLLKQGNELFAFARIIAALVGLHFYMAITAFLWLSTRARLRGK